MIMDKVLALKTNELLWAKIHGLSIKQLTEKEIFEQRVSFVYGSIDKDSTITRELVRSVVRNQVGLAEAI